MAIPVAEIVDRARRRVQAQVALVASDLTDVEAGLPSPPAPGALVTSEETLNDGAGAETATMTNAPTAGNPTKWIPIDDNGTTRYIPTWEAP